MNTKFRLKNNVLIRIQCVVLLECTVFQQLIKDIFKLFEWESYNSIFGSNINFKIQQFNPSFKSYFVLKPLLFINPGF